MFINLQQNPEEGINMPESQQVPVRHYMRPRQLAASLKVSMQTLAKWRMSAQGPRYRKVGKIILYDADEVARWMSENMIISTAESRKRRVPAGG